jgi:uncharacterized membrane protein YphA (DoxX/SURF4 family)
MEDVMSSLRTSTKAVRSAWSLIDRVDLVIIPFLRRWAVPLLRVSLGVVFVWFGMLKILDVSPVADLVANTVYWFDPKTFVTVLGMFEVTVGILLLLGRALRLTLLLFVLQMVGTFLTFVILPGVTFRDGSPFLLTVEGEFVVKNLVLISAALVVGTTVRRRAGRGAT